MTDLKPLIFLIDAHWIIFFITIERKMRQFTEVMKDNKHNTIFPWRNLEIYSDVIHEEMHMLTSSIMIGRRHWEEPWPNN